MIIRVHVIDAVAFAMKDQIDIVSSAISTVWVSPFFIRIWCRVLSCRSERGFKGKVEN